MSVKYKLNRRDGSKILKGLAIALIGAALTYLSELLPNVEWGVYAPLVTVVASVLVNAIRKWISTAQVE